MVRFRMFRQEDKGSVSLGVLEFAAGSITLGIMAVYAILSGTPTVPAGQAGAQSLWQGKDGGTATAARLNAPASLSLNEHVLLPVGSVAVHSDSGLTVFETPGGGWVDVWSRDGLTVPVGTTLTSKDSFQLPDGRTLDASAFTAAISEAYGSSARYAFK